MSEERIRPMIILPPECMSDDHIEALRKNGLCVVVAKDPAQVKFCDALASVSSRSQIENAAIGLSRKLLAGNHSWTKETTATFAAMYVELLMRGTPLDPANDARHRLFEEEKNNETLRLAREEARAERAAKKAADEKKATKT